MEPMTERQDLTPWHLDKRVPIALIATLAIQTGAVLWWAAKVDAKVDQNAQSITKNTLAIVSLQEAEIGRMREDRDLYGRLATMEADIRQMNLGIQRIERAVQPQRSSVDFDGPTSRPMTTEP